jgi:hypothetical protein
MGAGWHTDSSTRAKYVGTTLIVEARVTKTPLLGRGGHPAVSLHTQSPWPKVKGYAPWIGLDCDFLRGLLRSCPSYSHPPDQQQLGIGL